MRKIKFYFVTQITQQVYVAEEWAKDARNEAKAEFDAQSKVEKEVGNLKEDQAKLSEQLRVRLDGGVEKWEDGKLWEDGKDLVFLHLCLVERVEK